jgi:hypothetical protein
VRKEMKVYPIGELLALPLQSAIKAQNLAIQETISFIEQFGLEEGAAKKFTIKAERVVEERTIDPQTGEPKTEFKVQPFELSIPLLALISPPNIQLKEMNVEFGVEIVEPKSETINTGVIPSEVIGASLSQSMALYTPLTQSNPTTMKVNMKIVKEIPEGMARIGDLLTDLLSGQSVTEEPGPPSTRPPLPVENIPGIGRKRVALLKERNILTVKEFISAADTKEGIKELARALRVSEKRIIEWKKNAKPLLEGEQ